MVLIYMVQTSVSLIRINRFMNSDELVADAITHDEDSSKGNAVSVDSACFAWDKADGAEPALKNIELKIKTGELVAVVGAVGAGKSSLLSALLGEMELKSGKVKLFIASGIFLPASKALVDK